MLAVLLSACAGGLAAPEAQARSSTVDLTCFIQAQFTFSPALNFNTTSTRFSGMATSCVSPNGRYKELHSGVVFGTDGVTGTGCAPLLLQILGGNNTVFWSDGTTSKFTIEISTDPRSGKLGFVARLTAGRMAGAKISGVPAVITQRGSCLLGGVRGLTFWGVMAYTH